MDALEHKLVKLVRYNSCSLSKSRDERSAELPHESLGIKVLNSVEIYSVRLSAIQSA